MYMYIYMGPYFPHSLLARGPLRLRVEEELRSAGVFDLGSSFWIQWFRV